jgi:hypothetical protein
MKEESKRASGGLIEIDEDTGVDPTDYNDLIKSKSKK